MRQNKLRNAIPAKKPYASLRSDVIRISSPGGGPSILPRSEFQVPIATPNDPTQSPEISELRELDIIMRCLKCLAMMMLFLLVILTGKKVSGMWSSVAKIVASKVVEQEVLLVMLVYTSIVVSVRRMSDL